LKVSEKALREAVTANYYHDAVAQARVATAEHVELLTDLPEDHSARKTLKTGIAHLEREDHEAQVNFDSWVERAAENIPPQGPKPEA
jgi:predicted RNA-binding Zn ribbon-like protein